MRYILCIQFYQEIFFQSPSTLVLQRKEFRGTKGHCDESFLRDVRTRVRPRENETKENQWKCYCWMWLTEIKTAKHKHTISLVAVMSIFRIADYKWLRLIYSKTLFLYAVFTFVGFGAINEIRQILCIHFFYWRI